MPAVAALRECGGEDLGLLALETTVQRF